ncbi:MAG: sigma-70 family RNA polymerase sigma factor [Fimbriimonadaceae bacterium]|nr:sigma-70 family RNA polymerase sigma factor [Fimbriimonadaceae bacterium]QYK59637.1 MAG: sigma-70 family RNA polymerase sigma factor [Fimbriimonadaceae bacterium]
MSQAYDDTVLIGQCQKGDRTSFDRLVEKYEHRAYQYAYRLTRDSDEAADIVAEAFLRVYNAIGNFRSQAAFGTWLYRILTNCYLDQRKKDKSRFQTSLEATIQTASGEFERQVEDTRDGPVEETERAAREEAVQEALEKMPDYQRAMLVMFHIEGLAYEEIAEALDLPLGTVKSRLNRARVALRDHLASNMELFQIS